MSTFDGYFARQFGRRIRADRFTRQDPATIIQLLSHAHADHTVGLSSREIRGVVYCTHATREIVLKSTTAAERVHAETHGQKSDSYYTFKNLQEPILDARGKQKVKNGKKVRLDVLKPLDVGVRHDFSSIYGTPLAITLINANHCPGAVMFLIESSEYTVLYTGDVRADQHLIGRLRQDPFLQEYLASGSQAAKTSRKIIDQIYTDTSAALNKGRLVSKADGVQEALRLISQFPDNTRFFFNAWTLGYEDLLRAVAHAYKSKIHLDDYKRDLYSPTVASADLHDSSCPTSWPALNELSTRTYTSTRFHACERRWKCPHVRGDGQGCFEAPELHALWEDEHAKAIRSDQILKSKGLLPMTVFVNFAEATQKGWKSYCEKMELKLADAQIGKEDWPTSLLVPLARHSTLPELQDLVALFRPNSIYPNTLYPDLKGQDYLLLASYFGDHLARGGKQRLHHEAQQYVFSLDGIMSSNIASPRKPPVRLAAADEVLEESESQEAREEAESKFARVAKGMTEEYYTTNYDHLDSKDDLALLMAPEEEPDEEEEEEQPVVASTSERPYELSQELPEIRSRASKMQEGGNEAAAPENRVPVSAKGKGRETSAEPSHVPSSSDNNTLQGPRDQTCPPSTLELVNAALAQAQEEPWLAGQVFYLDEHCYEDGIKAARLIEVMEEAGGVVVKPTGSCELRQASHRTAIAAATRIICIEREGPAYGMAVKSGQKLANLTWLERVLAQRDLYLPDQTLLMQPFPCCESQDNANVHICISGFDVDQREVLKTMIDGLGATYAPDLAKGRTSVLITCAVSSKKNEYARKWDVPVVNFTWLEDCFAKGQLLPTADSRYTNLAITPRSVKRAIGQLQVDAELHEVTAPPPAAASIVSPRAQTSYVLQPAPAKRKQQPTTLHSASSPPKRVKNDPRAAPVTAAKKAVTAASSAVPVELPESFKSVSTTTQDDLERIHQVKEIITKGLGIPRLLSCEGP